MSVVTALCNVPESLATDPSIISFIEDWGLDIVEAEDCDLDPPSPPPSELLRSILTARMLPAPSATDDAIQRVLRFLAGHGVELAGVPFADGAALSDFDPMPTLDRVNDRAAAMAVLVFVIGKSEEAAQAALPMFRFLLCPRARADSL